MSHRRTRPVFGRQPIKGDHGYSTRGGTLIRLGGDEFALLLVQADLDGAKALAVRLIETLSAPYLAADINVSVSASIGIACGPDMEEDADMLIKHTDKAMYQAKAQGKSRVCTAPSLCIVSNPGQREPADAVFE